MTDAAPKRIWLQDAGDYSRAKAAVDELTWCDQPVDENDSLYILDTPEALASSPEVAALILEAEARGMERAAEICEGIRTSIANGPMPEGARFDYEQSIRAEAAAIRQGETT